MFRRAGRDAVNYLGESLQEFGAKPLDLFPNGSSMYRVENGQITEIWETKNTLTIMGQLNPEMQLGNHGH
jgi:hypothetical protein